MPNYGLWMFHNIQYALAQEISKNMFLYATLFMCTCDTIWHIATLLNDFSPQQITQKFDHNGNKYASSSFDKVALTNEWTARNKKIVDLYVVIVCNTTALHQTWFERAQCWLCRSYSLLSISKRLWHRFEIWK